MLTVREEDDGELKRRLDEAYLTLSQVWSDSGGINVFDEKHSEIIQLQPAEVVLGYIIHFSLGESYEGR